MSDSKLQRAATRLRYARTGWYSRDEVRAAAETLGEEGNRRRDRSNGEWKEVCSKGGKAAAAKRGPQFYKDLAAQARQRRLELMERGRQVEAEEKER